MTTEMTAEPLTALRHEIDRIDAQMHGLLMERGAIIDRLIAAKGTASSGSAFRPEREASMMRALGDRHQGRLPLETVEAIWRVVISTFTHVQAPFAVHLAGGARSPDGEAGRDSARFHFGFTVPLHVVEGAREVLAAVAASRGDLGLVPASGADEAWWRDLEPEGAPKIIARLPYVDRPGHPASLPLLVVSRRMSDEGLGAVVLRSVTGARLAEAAAEAIEALGGAVLARTADAALVAAPGSVPVDAIAAALSGSRLTVVGSHPERIERPPALPSSAAPAEA